MFHRDQRDQSRVPRASEPSVGGDGLRGPLGLLLARRSRAAAMLQHGHVDGRDPWRDLRVLQAHRTELRHVPPSAERTLRSSSGRVGMPFLPSAFAAGSAVAAAIAVAAVAATVCPSAPLRG